MRLRTNHCGRVRRAAGLLLTLAVPVVLCGCASPGATFGSLATSQPAVQSQGIVGAIMQGVKGVEINSALGLGATGLVGLVTTMVIRSQGQALKVLARALELAHKREMAQIEQDNGRYGLPTRGDEKEA